MSDPFAENAWPTQLTGRVVGPGPTLHGYAVGADLARHYRFSDVLFLSITGELPTDEQSRDFERTMIELSAISVAEAPSHAASLARICDASNSAVIATGAMALAEQARFMVREHPDHELLVRLRACGVARDEQLETAWVAARVAVVAAEGLATPRASFKDYPLNLPEVHYTEDR